MAESDSLHVPCVLHRKRIGEEADFLCKQGGGIKTLSARKVVRDPFDCSASELIVRSILRFPGLAKTVSASPMDGCSDASHVVLYRFSYRDRYVVY